MEGFFWRCPKGNYEALNRPKSKVGFEAVTTSKPFTNSGVGLPAIKDSGSIPIQKIMANGWTTPKRKPLYAP
ncbi:MAG: hypothetical protein A2Y79_05465 [Deltaproteobacteria bacterium RBG_13_43_22]|nr:MAG: hypothetical protein A2Y79_05465 [Deltaproteobacteria bacterium RBG_13_43_22]